LEDEELDEALDHGISVDMNIALAKLNQL
jgi:hypothetical protein